MKSPADTFHQDISYIFNYLVETELWFIWRAPGFSKNILIQAFVDLTWLHIYNRVFLSPHIPNLIQLHISLLSDVLRWGRCLKKKNFVWTTSCILKAAPILTLRITWSKLISFFLGLDTATSSLTVGLSNLFMKLSEIRPGSKALKPATCGVRNASSSRRWMLFMHQSICSMRLIVHQLWGYAKKSQIVNSWFCLWLAIATWKWLWDSNLSMYLPVACMILGYVNMLQMSV